MFYLTIVVGAQILEGKKNAEILLGFTKTIKSQMLSQMLSAGCPILACAVCGKGGNHEPSGWDVKKRT
jgi:hypothetical protein